MISIHALREESDGVVCVPSAGIPLISIHALREESDRSGPAAERLLRPISIHALREEGDPLTLAPAASAKVFLSTPSARRATYESNVPSVT